MHELIYNFWKYTQNVTTLMLLKPVKSITYSRLLPEITLQDECELTWHCSRPGLGAGTGMPEGPSAGECIMNESMRFTWTQEDTVHPPPSTVANCGLQRQRRSSWQETPSYSSSMRTLDKWLHCPLGNIHKHELRGCVCTVGSHAQCNNDRNTHQPHTSL